MVSYKSKYLSKALLIFVIFTFFVQPIHCFYVTSFALKRPNYSVYYCYHYGVHWASLQICEVRHCQLCLTSAKQILINKLKVCLFSQTNCGQRIMLLNLILRRASPVTSQKEKKFKQFFCSLSFIAKSNKLFFWPNKNNLIREDELKWKKI